LKDLNLESNLLGTEGALMIFKALSFKYKSFALQNLNIADNQINDTSDFVDLLLTFVENNKEKVAIENL